MNRIVAFIFLTMFAQVSYAACDQTLSTGANIASAVSSAANGTTICLNNGTYGTHTFDGITKTSYVTVTSTIGRGATISPMVRNSRFLRFDNLTINGAEITNASRDIQFTNNTNIGGMGISMTGASKVNYPLNLLIDGSTFYDNPQYFGEGRLSITDDDGHQASMGLVISNNEMGSLTSGCVSDGVQLFGGASGVQIGPGNTFKNIIQDASAVHCDAIQFYGSGWNNSIINNIFYNGSSYMQITSAAPDNTTVSNNVFDGGSDSNPYKVRFGSSTGLMLNHNTFINSVGLIFSEGQTATIKNNIFRGSNIETSDIGYGACGVCTFSYNLFDSSAQGTNAITGSPTFIGGTNPAGVWANYQLTSGSLGYQNGDDGANRGTTFYGSAPTIPTISALVCSLTSIQAPSGSTECTVTASNAPTSYSYSFSSCAAASCSTTDTDSVATVSCSNGGSCTVCATATNVSGTSGQFCTSSGYLKSKYRKPSNLQAN